MSLPLENLDDKSFAELVEEAKKRIPIYAPQWTDHNRHDPGITLIELFAWVAETQIYRLNKITERSYRNFLTLTGLSETEGKEESKALETAVLEARKDLKSVTRAVTCGDYETLALDTPDVNVARAKAIPRYHPYMQQEVCGSVTLIAVPDSESPDPDFLEKVYNHLDKHRLLSARLFVTLPLYVNVRVKVKVIIRPEFLERTVEANVKKRLDHFLHPLTGGSDGKGWPFGRPVYVSEIYEVIDGVEGVDHAATGTIRLRKDQEAWQRSDILIPRHGLLLPGEHIITAKEVNS